MSRRTAWHSCVPPKPVIKLPRSSCPKPHYAAGRTCLGCNATLSRYNPSNRCWPCQLKQ